MGATLPLVRKKTPTEAEIDAVINKGGSTTREATQPVLSTPNDDTVKYFNMRLTSGVLKRIEAFREKRPRKLGSPKLGISTHDWILEAIEEKMQREGKKYSI